MEEISRRIFRQLDHTGYSYGMIEKRREYYRRRGSLDSMKLNLNIVIVGSKGDGITKPFENDNDILCYANDTVCIEDPASDHLHPAHITVFTIKNTKPGYCMLKLPRTGLKSPDPRVANSLVPFNEKVMLSSQKVRQAFATRSTTLTTKTTGPAMTVTFDTGLTRDSVLTIPCHCLSILTNFVNRPRPYDWPSSSLRQTILLMNGNLVAKGPDDSETEYLEWRYCFNEIEMRIMATLNDTQLKLYKLMTIINNDIFKQRDLPLTSFIMKNIIFWLVEKNKQSMFLPETLYHWLCEALKLLKQYVDANNIPYYIIPDRNLLKEKVKASDRPRLIQVISDVIESGPAMLFECETMRKYAYLTSEELAVFKHKMEDFEPCCLEYSYTYTKLDIPGNDPYSDLHLRMLHHRMKQMVSSGWPHQLQQQIDDCENWVIAYKMLLS